jgi:predicted Zn finger-like uncharacterized protein
MKVTCPSCNTKYRLDGARVPAAGAKLRCAKCHTVFPVVAEEAAPSVLSEPASPARFSEPAVPPQAAPPESPFTDIFSGEPSLPGHLKPAVAPPPMGVQAGPIAGGPEEGWTEPPFSEAELPPAFGGPRDREQMGPAIDFSFDPAAAPPAPSESALMEPPSTPPGAADFDFGNLPPAPAPQEAEAIPEFSENLPAPVSEATGIEFAGDLPVPVGEDLPSPLETEAAAMPTSRAAPAAGPQTDSVDFEELPQISPVAAPVGTKEQTNPRQPSARPAAASLERLREIYEGRMAAVTVVRNETAASKLKRKLPLLIAGALSLIFVSGGVGLGFTRYGFFGLKRILLSQITEGSPQYKKLDAARKALLADTFEGYQQARDGAAELLREKPYAEAQALWCQAVFYLSRKFGASSASDLSRAAALLETIPLLGDRNVEVVKATAGNALSTGYPEQALALLQDAVARARNDRDLDLFFLLAEAYSAKNQPKLALEVLNKVLAKHKRSARGLHALGDVYRGLKQLDKATAAYSDALTADSNHLSSAVELASIALLVQKNAELAANTLAPALEKENQKYLGPQDLSRVHALNGMLLLSDGKPKEAVPELEMALKLDSRSILAKSNLAAALLAVRDFERAATAYSEVTEADPQNPDLAEGYLSALVSSGKVNEALDVMKKFNAKFPGNARIAYQNGRIQEATGYTGEAESSYKRAIASAPDFVEARVSLARFYLNGRRIPDAKAELEEAATRAPKSALVHAGLGELALAEKELNRAKSEFDLSAALDPELPDGHVGLSRIAFSRGDYQAARVAVDHALERQPRARDARLQLGLILWKTGDLKGSLTELSQAKEQDPRSARALIALGAVMLDQGDPGGAEANLATAISFEPSNPDGHFYMAKLHAKRGEFSAAIDSMKTALERARDNPVYHYELGLIYRDAKRIPDALEEWKRTVELDPSSADGYHALGQAYLNRGDYASAVGSFEKALAADPKRVKELELAGDAYFQEGKWDKAISRYTAALKADSRLKTVFYKLGRAYTEKGNNRAAIEWYQKAAEAESENPMTFYYLGYLYKEKGRRREAIVAFKDYLAKKPTAEDKQEIEDEIYDLQH